MIVRLHFLAHVIVLMFDLYGCSAGSVFLVDEIYAFLHICLLLLVKTYVVVTDDV